MQAIHKAVTVGGVDDKRSDSEEGPSDDENYNQGVDDKISDSEEDLSEDENYNQVKKES